MAKIYQNRGGTLTPILDTATFVDTSTNQSVAGNKSFSGTVTAQNPTAGDVSSKVATTKFVHDELVKYTTIHEEKYTASAAVASGSTITIPSSITYVVGSNSLEVYYNGLIEYRGDQYNELGTQGTESSTISILHNLEAGDELLFRIGAVHSDTGEGGSGTDVNAVHKTGSETIDGVKTFNTSPLVPTVTPTSDKSTKAASTAFVHNIVDTYMNSYDGVLDVSSAIASGSNVTLPGGISYTVGSNMLMISYNGSVCYLGKQYQEVGTNGSTSTQIKILFPLSVGDELAVHINGLADTTTFLDAVRKTGNETIQGLKTFSSTPSVTTPGLGDYSNLVATTKWVKDLSVASVYVSPSGSDSNNGLSAAESVKTIGKAIELLEQRAKILKVIILAAGTYTENIYFESLSIEIQLTGNVTLNGQFSISNNASVTIIGDPNTFTISTSGRSCIQMNNTSNFICGVPISMVSNGGAYTMGCSLSSNIIFTKSVNISATNNTYGVVYVNNRGNLYAGAGMTITGSGNTAGIIGAVGSNIVSNTIDIGNGVVNGSAIMLNHVSALKVYSGIVSIYGGTGYTIDVSYNSILASDNNVTSTSIVKTGTGPGLISSSFGSAVNIAVATNKTCSFSATGTSATDILYTNMGGAIRLMGAGTVTFSGTVTGATVSANENSTVTIQSTLTLNGTVTGKRYGVNTAAFVGVGGAGANRIPGTVAGTVNTNQMAFYG